MILDGLHGNRNAGQQAERALPALSRVAATAMLSLLLVGVVGCPDSNQRLGPIEDPPLPMGAVIERVNFNNYRMDFLLRGGGSASGRWRRGQDDSAQSTSFDMSAILLYRKPRDLYLRLEHRLGGPLEAGSNNREFWVWERLNGNRYWWGEHRWMKDAEGTDLPVRPDVLLDVLGVGDLPAITTGPRGPVFWIRETHYQLVFLSTDEDGQNYISKVMNISRRPPYLVEAIHYFDPDGRPMMEVLLSKYGPIEGSDVLAPRKIEMKSLENDNYMTLSFTTMRRFDQPGVDKKFVSPMQKGDANLSYVRRVDNWHPEIRPVSRPATQTTSAPASPLSSQPAETRPVVPADRSDAVTK